MHDQVDFLYLLNLVSELFNLLFEHFIFLFMAAFSLIIDFGITSAAVCIMFVTL